MRLVKLMAVAVCLTMLMVGFANAGKDLDAVQKKGLSKLVLMAAFSVSGCRMKKASGKVWMLILLVPLLQQSSAMPTKLNLPPDRSAAFYRSAVW